MLELIMLRHGPTDWNRDKRLQGRRDMPLSESARQRLAKQQLPTPWRTIPWYCSPLCRAVETAELLGLNATPARALIEMDWGDWEGRRIEELRREDPDGMARCESAGLRLHPPGGESPLQVQRRVTAWAEEIRRSGTLIAGAVCHKGVLRALLAAACDWPMRGKAPIRLDYDCLQHFAWDGRRWRILEANHPLEPR